MNQLFRKRYNADNKEDRAKNQNDVKAIEAAMRGIGKALESYHPHYQAIVNINKSLGQDLVKFYDKFPHFKEVGDHLLQTFVSQNEQIESLMQKIVAFRSQFNSWFLNFDVIKDLYKKFDTAEQNFLHYSEKIVKLREKAGAKVSQKDQDQILGNEKKLSEAKNMHELVTTELGQINDKILYLSYTVVNSSISEFLESKTSYYASMNERYQVYDNLSGKLTQIERDYLASFEEQVPVEGAEKTGGKTSFRNQMLRARQNMISDPERDKVNPFQSFEDANPLDEMFNNYQNGYSTGAPPVAS